MRLPIKLCLASVLTWTLTACGALPTQNFEHSTRATVKRVDIVPIGTPEHTEVRIMNPIGAGFGVVGNLVEARRAVWASQAMETTLAAVNFDFRASLSNAITQAIG